MCKHHCTHRYRRWSWLWLSQSLSWLSIIMLESSKVTAHHLEPRGQRSRPRAVIIKRSQTLYPLRGEEMVWHTACCIREIEQWPVRRPWGLWYSHQVAHTHSQEMFKINDACYSYMTDMRPAINQTSQPRPHDATYETSYFRERDCVIMLVLCRGFLLRFFLSSSHSDHPVVQSTRISPY